MQKILVIQQKMIGDVLISTLLCENLRQAYPNAQIDYMVYESTSDILNGHSSFDNLVLFKPEHRKSKLALLNLIKSIRRSNYDIVIDAYAKLESQLATLFSGATKKISYQKSKSDLIYTHSVLRKKKSSSNLGLIIEHRLALLKPLGITDNLITHPKVYVTEDEKNFAEKLFKKHKLKEHLPNVMISAIGSELAKTYPAKYMAQVVEQIVQTHKVNILFNYLPKQKDIALRIYNSCSTETQKYIYFDLLGNSLREFIAIMNECDLIIGNDGGAINIAKALKKPAFTIFSPWIDKAGWATFEDGNQNSSVHLKDFRTDLFTGISTKEIKKSYQEFYENFKPNLFENQLNHFLNYNLSPT
ncbi:glycosyltransferase family 9 protein [Leeuwenhoekiella aestuarii]|uniref:Heptosyltransferase-2 n=1 Tax=Leeuwenhoekiella aestuarii TaxID=2249426 RepID=A0A4Q0NX33_9FLAO|nr:glycosyltransferase family 9 protein [Leeuwenhoekiella aestuarii]RXG16833.1 heptosyltransferase-2 [Leeuwenhoekiella aestuarii]